MFGFSWGSSSKAGQGDSAEDPLEAEISAHQDWDGENIEVLSAIVDTRSTRDDSDVPEAEPRTRKRSGHSAVERLRPSFFGVGWDGAKSALDLLESSAKRTERIPAIPGVPNHDLGHATVTQTLQNRPDLFCVQTPIRHKELQTLLRSHPNLRFVKSLVDGFEKGFWPGANTAQMNTSSPIDLDPANQRPRQAEQIKFLRTQCEHEVSKGRYSRAFGDELLPGMVCTPVFTKRKPGPKKFRIINNHSAGDHSLNSMIPNEAAYVQVDTLTHLASRLRLIIKEHGRPPRWLFTSDVAEAFRIIPIHPRWQVRQVNRIDGCLHVDRNAVFGNRGSMKIFCQFLAAVLWCAEKDGLKDIFHYVDDSFSYDFVEDLVSYPPYKRKMPKKQVELLHLFDRLGIPHEDKKQKFGTELEIIGFLISLDHLTISLPAGKLENILKMMDSFVRVGRHTVAEWWELLGVANWALQAAPKLRPALNSSFSAIARKTSASEKVQLSPEVTEDLKWFARQLREAKPIRIVDGGFWENKEADLEVCCKALDGGANVHISCTSEDVSFVAPLDSDSGEGTVDCPEARSVLLALKWATQQSKPFRRLLIRTNSKNMLQLFNQLKAPDAAHKKILYDAIELMIKHDTDARVSSTEKLEMPPPKDEGDEEQSLKNKKQKGNSRRKRFGLASNYAIANSDLSSKT